MNLILNIAVIVLAFIIFFRGIYYFFEALQLLISVKRGKVDERETLIVYRALAFTMIIVALMHFIQLIIGWNVREYFQSINRPYIPFISSGMPYGAVVENAPLHIEAILFDTFLFGVIYPLQKRKFGG